MAGALFICGRLPGVHRPSLPGYFPTPTGTALVVDVGANVDVKPEHLVQFAQMGRIFAERVFGVDLEPGQLGEPEDGCQQIVEVVSDSTRQAAETLEFL